MNCADRCAAGLETLRLAPQERAASWALKLSTEVTSTWIAAAGYYPVYGPVLERVRSSTGAGTPIAKADFLAGSLLCNGSYDRRMLWRAAVRKLRRLWPSPRPQPLNWRVLMTNLGVQEPSPD